MNFSYFWNKSLTKIQNYVPDNGMGKRGDIRIFSFGFKLYFLAKIVILKSEYVYVLQKSLLMQDWVFRLGKRL